MQLHPRLPGVFLLALGLAAIMSACESAQPSGSPQPLPVASALGTIAYIDSSGCVARADAATGQPAGEAYCPASRKGATSVTWIDQDSAAYVTAESKAMGWQLVHFDSGKSETMDIADGPRVYLIPPQYYSSRGEKLAITVEGVVSLVGTGGDTPIFPPANQAPDASTRLVAWSPDGEWVLLSTSTDKELWIVGRLGANPRRIAQESRGVASWFMPAVGATPHADLSCSVTTSQSFGCVTPLRTPWDGTVVNPASTQTADFTWSACPGATGYQIDIFTTDSAAPLVSAVVAGTFLHQPIESLPAGTFIWRVRALIGSIPAPWSEERTLTVGGGDPR